MKTQTTYKQENSHPKMPHTMTFNLLAFAELDGLGTREKLRRFT
jgi:hypothetical protein